MSDPLSALALSSLHRAKTKNPVDTIEEFLARIAAGNRALNALRFVDEAGARERAAALPVRGAARLAGVPFSVKDHIDVAGLPRSEGTLRGAVDASPSSASLVSWLLDEGAICIGKGNMAEYGKSYFTENLAFGRTTNPFGAELSPGGSGGGDAAAVAAGFASFGLGADSGGSVRIPANFCGLFGLAPTPGHFSCGGLTSEPHTTRRLFRTPGLLARTRADLALLTRILSRFDPRDSQSRPAPLETKTGFWDEWFRSSKRRFAWFSELNGCACDEEIRTALIGGCTRFETLGFRAEEIEPKLFEKCYEPFILLAGQAALIIEDFVAAATGSPRDHASESPSTRHLRERIATELPPLNTETLLAAWYAVDSLRNQVPALFGEYDFVLAPVAATLAPPHGTTQFPVNGKTYQSQEVFQFASSANVLGIPAIAFPTGLANDGRPVGIQIMGPAFSEFFLLELLAKASYEVSLTPPA